MNTFLVCLAVAPVEWIVGYQIADWLDRAVRGPQAALTSRELGTPARSEPAVIRRTVDANGETIEIRSWG